MTDKHCIIDSELSLSQDKASTIYQYQMKNINDISISDEYINDTSIDLKYLVCHSLLYLFK
jgi:hypothetical protein